MTTNKLNHLAVIMDGNGRWARSKNLSKIDGHKFGVETAKKIIQAVIKENIKYLTLYTFSIENWHRPQDEVNGIMDILKFYIDNEASELQNNDIKVIFVGDLTKLPESLQKSIAVVSKITANNNNLTLYIALSYGGRQEIINACKSIIDSGISLAELDEKSFSKHLYVPDMPEIDLLIRTSGEKRISNFLLWHLAYSELYFSDKYWPEFTEQDLRLAIQDFKKRKRNFGHSRNA